MTSPAAHVPEDGDMLGGVDPEPVRSNDTGEEFTNRRLGPLLLFVAVIAAAVDVDVAEKV
jgi:hypothetical protein